MIGSSSCDGFMSCFRNKGEIADDACHGTESCSGIEGAMVETGACVGTRACYGNSTKHEAGECAKPFSCCVGSETDCVLAES